jgi:hypothetical protein
MLYDDADFNNTFDPLYYIEGNTGSTTNVNLVVLQDQEMGPASIWYINESKKAKLMEELGEVNMGNYTTLSDFVSYCKFNFPSDRYMLTLYNHGGAWQGACWDDTDDDHLQLDEIQKSLSVCDGVDIISFSACEMGCIEGAYEIRDNVEVYIGSEEMHGFGLYWLQIPGLINAQATDSTKDIGEAIIGLFEEMYPYLGNIYGWTLDLLRQLLMGILPYPPALTISAIQTNELDSVVSSIDSLATLLIENLNDYKQTLTRARLYVEDYTRPMKLYSSMGTNVDIYHFVDLLDTVQIQRNKPLIHETIETIKKQLDLVIIDEHHQIGHARSRGLSVYFPPPFPNSRYKEFDTFYANCGLDFTEDTQWNEFLDSYFE